MVVWLPGLDSYGWSFLWQQFRVKVMVMIMAFLFKGEVGSLLVGNLLVGSLLVPTFGLRPGGCGGIDSGIVGCNNKPNLTC